jgi:hypothetical protein
VISRRMLGAAVVAASAASMIGIGANAAASSHPTDANNHQTVRASSRGWTASAAPTQGASTHTYSLAASAFAADSSGDSYYNAWDPSALTESTGCANAGLSLPDNATLKSVTIYYTSGDNGLTFQLTKQDLLNHTFKDLAAYASKSSTTSTYTEATKKLNSRVKYGTYAYSVGVCPDSDSTSISDSTSFSGLTITYTTP